MQTPALSGTERASASLSAAVPISPNWSRSHCIMLPATNSDPSSA
jgi:hypothetical protein